MSDISAFPTEASLFGNLILAHKVSALSCGSSINELPSDLAKLPSDLAESGAQLAIERATVCLRVPRHFTTRLSVTVPPVSHVPLFLYRS